MRSIWRFYVDPDQQWRWQRLAADRAVISESRVAYKEYEGCLANAESEGYVFKPAQTKLPRANAR